MVRVCRAKARLPHGRGGKLMKKQKSLFRIDTHLRSEWRWAYTSMQAAWLVYQEYRS